jgi:hypothetical protein
VLATPTTQLLRSHAVHTRRAPVTLDASQRDRQILRSENLTPQTLTIPDVFPAPAERPLRTDDGPSGFTGPSISSAPYRGLAAVIAAVTRSTASNINSQRSALPSHHDSRWYYDLC